MDVRQVCCEFLQSQLHPTNCLGIRAFADLHTCTQLLNQAHTFAGKPLHESSVLKRACLQCGTRWNFSVTVSSCRVFASRRAAFLRGGAGGGVSGPLTAAGVQPHLQRQTHRFHRGEGQAARRTHTHTRTQVFNNTNFFFSAVGERRIVFISSFPCDHGCQKNDIAGTLGVLLKTHSLLMVTSPRIRLFPDDGVSVRCEHVDSEGTAVCHPAVRAAAVTAGSGQTETQRELPSLCSHLFLYAAVSTWKHNQPPCTPYVLK